MIGKTERVVLVKGDATKWWEQAIFIVNPSAEAEEMPTDFVSEAEKIINEYNLRRANKQAAPVIYPPIPPAAAAKKRRADFALSFLMGVACFVIVAVLIFGLLR